MTEQRENTWLSQNQLFLSTRLNEIATYISTFGSEDAELNYSESNAIASEMEGLAALQFITQAFGLTIFEEFVLALCAGYELDSNFAGVVDNFSIPNSKPCFGMALSVINDSHWSAVTPVGALRHWRLIEVEPSKSIITSRLKIDERILHYLAGVSYLDKRLEGLLKVPNRLSSLAPIFKDSVKDIITAWDNRREGEELPLIHLTGARQVELFAITISACQSMDLILYHFDTSNIPSDAVEQAALIKLWQRESIIDRAVLLITDSGLVNDKIASFLNAIYSPTILISSQSIEFLEKPTLRFDVPKLSSSDQKEIWAQSLGGKSNYLNGGVERLVSQFNLSADSIQSIGKQASLINDCSAKKMNDLLWQSCRLQSRKRLDSLAQRISSLLCWDDLILPESQKQTLRDIVSHARKRYQVYETWGFSSKSTIGRGISALFHGPSGTGKTMAASVIAHELQLDLYRIDLSQVVNKYIGETEKNIGKVFDAAEDSGAILLFDEADSLFAKRTEVKNSHDRNANMETSYLLQRMESYSGIAILTTNLKKEMDTAFMRRIRFAIQFPFPDQKTREEIWQRVFPDKVPLGNIDIARLASLDVAGGNIRNIAINAAFFAADSNEAVKMQHMAKAARREFSKLEKSIKESELRSWV